MKKILCVSIAMCLSSTVFAYDSDSCEFPILNTTGVIKAAQQTGEAYYVDGNSIDVTEIEYHSASTAKEIPELPGATSMASNAEVDISLATSAEMTVLNPESNADDLTGASISTFYDAGHNVIARIGQIGWGYGLCR